MLSSGKTARSSNYRLRSSNKLENRGVKVYLCNIIKANEMKASDKNRLKKALALLQKAQELAEQVAKSDSGFCYSGNAPISRIAAAVSIVNTEIQNAE